MTTSRTLSEPSEWIPPLLTALDFASLDPSSKIDREKISRTIQSSCDHLEGGKKNEHYLASQEAMRYFAKTVLAPALVELATNKKAKGEQLALSSIDILKNPKVVAQLDNLVNAVTNYLSTADKKHEAYKLPNRVMEASNILGRSFLTHMAGMAYSEAFVMLSQQLEKKPELKAAATTQLKQIIDVASKAAYYMAPAGEGFAVNSNMGKISEMLQSENSMLLQQTINGLLTEKARPTALDSFIAIQVIGADAWQTHQEKMQYKDNIVLKMKEITAQIPTIADNTSADYKNVTTEFKDINSLFFKHKNQSIFHLALSDLKVVSDRLDALSNQIKAMPKKDKSSTQIIAFGLSPQPSELLRSMPAPLVSDSAMAVAAASTPAEPTKPEAKPKLSKEELQAATKPDPVTTSTKTTAPEITAEPPRYNK